MLAILTCAGALERHVGGHTTQLVRQCIVLGALGQPVDLVVKLWFARQASRLSLAHAFFLVGIVGGLTLPDFSNSLPSYFGWLLRPAASILAVWLLADFDLRSHTFRRRSAIVVVALTGVGSLPFALMGVGFLPLTLAASGRFALLTFILLETAHIFPQLLLLVYLVRLRQPATELYRPRPSANSADLRC